MWAPVSDAPESPIQGKIEPQLLSSAKGSSLVTLQKLSAENGEARSQTGVCHRVAGERERGGRRQVVLPVTLELNGRRNAGCNCGFFISETGENRVRSAVSGWDPGKVAEWEALQFVSPR